MEKPEMMNMLSALDTTELLQVISSAAQLVNERQQQNDWNELVDRLQDYIAKWGEIKVRVYNDIFYLKDTLTITSEPHCLMGY